MKKVLMLASVASMIDQFNMPNIKLLQEMGATVDVACNFEKGSTSSKERIDKFKIELQNIRIGYFQIDFTRNVFILWQNVKVYYQLDRLIKQNQYDLIHCHSPIGGVLGRLIARKHNIRIIYTAHGFHFFKGAPLINWLVYYPIEKWLAKYTDVLITINKEDFERAKNFRAKRVEYVPGVGVDVDKFANHIVDRDQIRNEIGVPADSFMLLSVGELNKNKNHIVIIKALSKINNANIHYVIVGTGQLEKKLKNIAVKLGIGEQVHLLGYRSDVMDLYKAADLFCFPSKREGLPVSLIESMASGLPCICSNIRGNSDLITDSNYLCNDIAENYIDTINMLHGNVNLRKEIGACNQRLVQKYNLASVINRMKEIYVEVCNL